MSPGTVAVLTTAQVPGRRPCAVTLRFDPAHPLEVWADFGRDMAGTRIEWVFARDLLVEGLNYPVGFGDISVAPAGDRVAICLDNGEESSVLYLPATEVRRFVDRTLAWVPLGEEVGDFDQELAEWLDGAR